MREKDFDDLYRLEDHLWWFEGMRAITSTVLRGVKLDFGRILDAGCGTGGMKGWFQRHAPCSEHYYLDLDLSAVRYAKKRGLPRVVRASASELPFASESFSALTSFDVLVQLQTSDVHRALKEAHRLLQPGGTLFVRVAALPWMRGAHDVAMNSARRYTSKELREELERAGFQVRRLTFANTILLPLVFVKRFLLERGGRTGGASDVAPLPFQWLDTVFRHTLLLEAWLLRWVNLPIGLSLLSVAEKPKREERRIGESRV